MQGIKFWKSCRSVHSQSLEIWWCPWEHHRAHVHWYSWMNGGTKMWATVVKMVWREENQPKERDALNESKKELHHWIQCTVQWVSLESLQHAATVGYLRHSSALKDLQIVKCYGFLIPGNVQGYLEQPDLVEGWNLKIPFYTNNSMILWNVKPHVPVFKYTKVWLCLQASTGSLMCIFTSWQYLKTSAAITAPCKSTTIDNRILKSPVILIDKGMGECKYYHSCWANRELVSLREVRWIKEENPDPVTPKPVPEPHNHCCVLSRAALSGFWSACIASSSYSAWFPHPY